MSVKNVAATILAQLSAWGVKNIYGYIGDDVFYLFDALAREHRIKLYQVKHEETAALMASAHAKVTGEIGVCLADGGPGTVHLLNGLADAYTDRVPVLALTGQVSRKDIGTEAKQYLNQQLLMSAMTSYSEMLADAGAIIKVMDKAYRAAITQKSVAHITIPMDLFGQPCDQQIVPVAPYLSNYPVSSKEVINGAIAKIKQAQRPVILVGKGGRTAGALVSQLAVQIGAGIITTLSGLGSVDHKHPLYIGGLGHAGSPLSTKILEKSDLCIIVGANWWPKQYVPQNMATIEVDINPVNIGASAGNTYGLVGDCKTILMSLLEGLENTAQPDWQTYIESEVNSWLNELHKETQISGSPVHPAVVVNTLQKTIPEDAIICLDTGDNTVWFGRVFRPVHQKVILSGKWRTMGFGLPAALAAQINQPHRKVVVVVGDGGFTMTMADFLTAVKYNLPVVVVVFNNHSLAMEKNKMEAGKLVPEATTLINPDFASYAKICGGIGISVHNPVDLESAFRRGLAAKKPVIIDVNVSSVPVPETKMPT